MSSAALAVDGDDGREHGLDHAGVEAERRLVDEQESRLEQQRDRCGIGSVASAPGASGV